MIQIQLKRNLLRQNETAISFRGKTDFLHFSAAALWHSLWWVYSLLFRIKLWNLNLFTYESFMAVCLERPGPWLQMHHQTVYNHPHCRSLLGIWTKILPLFKLKFNQQHLDKRQLHQQKQKVHQTLEFSQTLAWFDLVQRTDKMSTINKAIQWSDQ